MSASNSPVFSWDRRVEFAETDAAGIAHFSSFFLYMEQAEHALFRQCGWSVFSKPHGDRAGPNGPADLAVTWPRVHCSCDFKGPAFFEDLLMLDVYIHRLGAKSITYRHVIRRGVEVLAEGIVTSVCSVVDPSSHRISSCAIPEVLRAKLQSLIDASVLPIHP